MSNVNRRQTTDNWPIKIAHLERYRLKWAAKTCKGPPLSPVAHFQNIFTKMFFEWPSTKLLKKKFRTPLLNHRNVPWVTDYPNSQTLPSTLYYLPFHAYGSGEWFRAIIALMFELRKDIVWVSMVLFKLFVILHILLTFIIYWNYYKTTQFDLLLIQP